MRTRPIARRTRSDSDNPTERALVCHSARSGAMQSLTFLISMIAFQSSPDSTMGTPIFANSFFIPAQRIF